MKGVADLTATSSKDLLSKLRNLESNRQKIAEERQNYRMQEVSSGAAQDEGIEGEFATKGKNKTVPKLTAAQSKIKEGEFATKGMSKPVTRLTANQSKLKEGEFGAKGINTKDKDSERAIDNKKDLIATQSKCKEGQPSPKRMKKPVPKKLDFSHLQGTFDAISRRVNTMPPALGEEQSITPEQPGCSKSKDLNDSNTAANKNQGPHIEPSPVAINNFESTKRDSTYGLQRDLEAIRKRNNTVQSTSVTQQRSSANSAQCAGNQGQHINVQNSKKFMWRYVNDAWKMFNGKLKQKHFEPYDNFDDMAISQRNNKNKKQQKFPHRMHEMNGTNEEPKRFEVFIATRTSRKRKELDEGTQTAIEIFQTQQASGASEEEAFQSIFGKEQPGRVRCYGRSVTQTDLRRHAKISAIKQQHQEEVTTLKSELGEVKTQPQQQAEEIHGLRSMVKLLLLRSEPDMRPKEVESMLRNAQNSPVDANSGHGSTHHVRNVSMDNLRDDHQD
ncbi:hypothetical protein PIB30_063474 [Stylosanthes scabra]|uniref:Uncharacterized protein n=1 Tax=Stylosanthes scabra TaxID=79078 RepID=A0ABU6WJQ6_9FABA|nr:hypothetical protein [Stylosanthes scabra]